jgi:hypothetical protein
MRGEETKLRLLVTVKAYPTPSIKHFETVCCAGITEDREWVRLYPVPYRDLPGQSKFRKYDVIEVSAVRPESNRDDRPESWKPIISTMKIVDHLDTKDNWARRMSWIGSTVLDDYTDLQRSQESENISLGAFRPASILGTKSTRVDDRWTPEQLAAIQQQDLFSTKDPLEPIPFRFHVGFTDKDGTPHWLSVIDWEFGELWRGERDRFKDEEKAAAQVCRKLEEVTGATKDIIFFAGNQADRTRRKIFMILGCCYPQQMTPRGTVQGELFS